MAIKFAESFDWTTTATGSAAGALTSRGYTLAQVSTGMGRGTGRINGYGWSLYGTNSASFANSIRNALPSHSSGIFSFSFNLVALPSVNDTTQMFALRSGATTQLGIVVTTAGRIIVQRGTTTLATTTNPVISAGTWHRVEFGYTIHDTTGSYEVRVDGVNVLSATNVDTRNGTPTDVDTFIIGQVISASTGVNGHVVTYDDLVFNDSTGSSNTGFLGDLHIEQLRPNSDDSVAWTRSTGSDNYALVDDTALDTADFVTAATALTDRYGLTDLVSIPTGVFAVQGLYHASKDDAGTCTMRTRVTSGSDVANGTTVGLTTSGGVIADLYETDPQGGGAWIGARVNAAKLSIERVS